MTQPQQAQARARLEQAHQQIPKLLAAPDTPSPEFEDWAAGAARALRLGLGESHSLVREFDVLTMVHTAYGGQPGRPLKKHEQRTPPHRVLNRGRDMIEDAISILAQGDAAASAAEPSAAAITVSPADPGTADDEGGHPKALISYAWESDDHKTSDDVERW